MALASHASVLTVDDVPLCYDTLGNPTDPPLLLIQGLGAQLVGWHPELCARIAAAGFFVVRHDNRDAGLSRHFPEGGYTLVDMARDSAGLLTALDLGPAHVIGQSMGGMIAQQMALDHPEVVRSLGLLYTSAHTGHIMADAVEERRHLPTARDRAQAVELYLTNEAPCATAAYPHDEGWLRELGGLMYDRCYDPDASDRQLTAIQRSPDRRPGLRALDIPTTVLHGDGDALIAPAAAAELHALLTGSSLHIYPGMGHSLPRALWHDIVERLRVNAQR